MSKSIEFTDEELEALAGIVEQWIHEGFKYRPWDDPVYASIFEKTGIDKEWLKRFVGDA